MGVARGDLIIFPYDKSGMQIRIFCGTSALPTYKKLMGLHDSIIVVIRETIISFTNTTVCKVKLVHFPHFFM